MSTQTPPLVVDLDGTLILSDSLHELALAHGKAHPLGTLLNLPLWLRAGKAHLKAQLASRHALDVATLPYNLPLLDWLREQHAAGRTLVLCTGADRRVAEAVADHLGIFHEVLASDGQLNLTAERKAQALVERYGAHGFDYAGNSRADLPVWQQARQTIVANASTSLERTVQQLAAQQQIRLARVFPAQPPGARSVVRMLRLHQWLKNLLLFVPLLGAHQWGNVQALGTLLVAFVAFGLCASAVYIANDLLDLPSDRQHPRKRSRPFASGRIPLHWGVALAPVLLLVSVLLACWVGTAFLGWLTLYFVLTCWYSTWLKRLVLVDCMTLASLYSLRIIAGGAAAHQVASDWLLAVSGFIFLSLAFLKRYTELRMVAGHDEEADADAGLHGRGYLLQDAPLIQMLGIAAGYAAAVVLALYLHGDTVRGLYRMPNALLLTVGVMLFWISWMWLLAHRGRMHDDPVFFAIKNPVSLLCGLGFFVTLMLAARGLPSWEGRLSAAMHTPLHAAVSAPSHAPAPIAATPLRVAV